MMTRRRDLLPFCKGLHRILNDKLVYDKKSWWYFKKHIWRGASDKWVSRFFGTRVLPMLKRVFYRPGFADSFDRDPWTLSLANGLLNLRTRTFRAGKRDDLVSKRVQVVWEGLDEPCPTFMRYLRETFPTQEAINRTLRIMGYSLSGDTSGGRCFHHTQANLGPLKYIIGYLARPYCCDDRDAPEEIGEQLGVRVVICSASNAHDADRLMSIMPGAKVHFFPDEPPSNDDLIRELRKEASGILACLVRAGIENRLCHC